MHSIQQAQAAELLAGAGATDLPLALVGDLNSPADGNGTTYNTLRGGQRTAHRRVDQVWPRDRPHVLPGS